MPSSVGRSGRPGAEALPRTTEAAAFPSLRSWLGLSLALVAVLVAVDYAPLPRADAQWFSDLLQLGLALAASALCARAGLKERSLGRAFWWLLGIGTLIWATGQAFWTLESVALHPNATRSVSDLLFLAYTTPVIVAFLVRPDRPRESNARLAFDMSLLLVLLFHADAYFALGELLAGRPDEFQSWQVALLNVRGVVVLTVFLRLMRRSRPPWDRLYRQLGLAFVVLHGGGAFTNLRFAAGVYHPGLLDLGWTMPFLWIGLAAAGWRAQASPEDREPVAALEWRDTRRGTVLALLAVVLVPVLHFVNNSLDPPNPAEETLRSSITLVTTVVVGGLFVLRQLHILRRVEETQAEREERLRLLFASNPHPMWVTDRGTLQFLEVNQAAVDGYGYSRDEFLAMRMTDLRGPLGDRHHLLKDGRLVDVEIASQDLAFAGRAAALVVATDVTERNRAEAELRRSEERFQKAFRASPAAMSISTFQEGRILDVNDRYCEMTGYPREDLIGKTVTELGLWADARERAALVRTVRETGPPRGFDLRLRRKSGEVREARTSYELVEVGGEACLLGLSEDVSERRLLEAQLRQAQKMEAVGRLAGGIAHDFNNLLTAILGYTDLLLRGLGPADPLRRNAQEIVKASERAAGLTRQLLAFGRKQVLVPEVLDLRAVVAETESMLRRLIGEDIELLTVTPADLGMVKADRGQVEQVIMNLAVNARDAMPTGGKLTIAVGNAEIEEGFVRANPGARPGPHVRLAVADNGAGMSAETQSHLFEPFFTTKDVGKGTGLGLATVYGIVKQSGGYIGVRTELGRGTTFEIYLPRVEEAPSARPSIRAGGAPPGAETILLVEDEEAVRSLIREVLESAGYRILDAPSGPEALRLSQDHAGPIHLMMTDVVMPGMSGPQLAERMAASRPDMRILFASGYTDDALGPDGRLAPGHAFIQKPWAPDALAARVREVLDGAPSARARPDEPA